MNQVQPASPTWRKSSYSGQSAQECVETADLSSAVGVRDSKDLTKGHLSVEPSAWTALTDALKSA